MKPKITAYSPPPHHRKIGVTIVGDVVTLFKEVIRNGRLSWKKVGSAKWDNHHGFYGVSGLDYEDLRTIEDNIRYSK
jgi:hypothetical protein